MLEMTNYEMVALYVDSTLKHGAAGFTGELMKLMAADDKELYTATIQDYVVNNILYSESKNYTVYLNDTLIILRDTKTKEIIAVILKDTLNHQPMMMMGMNPSMILTRLFIFNKEHEEMKKLWDSVCNPIIEMLNQQHNHPNSRHRYNV